MYTNIPIKPYAPTQEEQDRWNHSALRKRMIIGAWEQDLEDELASYHPNHPDHYEETRHHSFAPDGDATATYLPGTKDKEWSLRLPANATNGVGIAKLLRGKKPGRRHSAVEILGSVRKKKLVGRQGRRPSIIRAHKSTGLFH